MREVIAYATLVGVSAFLLYLWVEIWLHGEFFMGEDNLGIRLWETLLWSALIVFGLYGCISRLLRR